MKLFKGVTVYLGGRKKFKGSASEKLTEKEIRAGKGEIPDKLLNDDQKKKVEASNKKMKAAAKKKEKEASPEETSKPDTKPK